MGAIFRWFREECRKLLPVMAFFFIAFSLANISHIIMHNKAVAAYYSFAFIAIASLMMGKVVFLSDLLPITNRFSHKPLIYNTVWKSFIYWICSFFMLILDRVLPLYFEGENWQESYQKIAVDFSRPEFWVSFVWIGFLLLIFVGYRELINAIGADKVRKLFFGK